MNPSSDKLASQHEALKSEVIKLFQAVQEIKVELATIKHPNSDMNHFSSLADQLNEIADETEKASNAIMQSAESISDTSGTLQKATKLEGAQPMFDAMTSELNTIFEACGFHDITGQRISKIIKIVNLIEGTLNSLVTVVGEDGISALPLTESPIAETDDVAMEGPALGGEGVSQADIDKLFD
jgi:chemotaxis regulatin CheY-phosphate phosphatase CheZ